MRQLLNICRRNAFTLLEMLVVIVILAVLLAVAIPQFLQQPIKAKDAKAKSYLTLAWEDLTANATTDEANFGTASDLVGQLRYDEPQLNFQTVSDCSTTTMASYNGKTVVVVGPQTNGAATVLCIKSDSGHIFELIAPVSGADPTIVDISTLTGKAPVNVAPALITGDPRYGQRLTVQEGGWESVTPPVYSYQWQKCNSSGSSCTNISGATDNSYLIGIGDVGSTFKAQVTAANAYGSASVIASLSQTANTNLAGLPQNTSLPTVSGVAAQGQTLTADKGTWTGTAPISYSYQWQHSSDGGSTWTNIAGATGTTYLIPAADVGNALRIRVAAVNAPGEQDAYSAATGAVIPPPSNTVPPAITGTAQDGQTLNSSTGTWTASPTSYAYQWQYSSNGGSTWTNLSGATTSSWTIPYTTYVGDTFRVQVTATNAAGSTTASSNATAADTAAPPVNTGAPSFTGTAKDGQILSGANGSWTGTATITYSDQWQYSSNGGSTWANIAGATSINYTIPYGTYTGDNLRLQVTATNSAGSSSAQSGQSPAVAPAPPTNTSAPSFTGTAKDGQTLSGANGSWTGTPTISYSYQWQYSANGGGSWSSIGGATSINYTIPYGSYTGDIVRLQVTATNAGGSTGASSAASATIAAAAPSNTSVPTFTGSVQAGQTLTSTTGSWTGTPTITFSYQWQRSTDGGSTWSSIGGATSSTYTLTSSDVNYIVRSTVTATNSAGNATANSAASSQVSGTPPVNTVAPAISGTAQYGQTLTSSAGTWTAAPANQTYSYQWQSSSDGGSTWANLSGATSSSYTIQLADVGNVLRAQVTATNSCNAGCGPTTASAAQTAQVTGQIPVASVVPYAGTTSLPSGWALADGSCGYTSASYPDLWTAIGTTYGGTGSSNFCLPDLRGRMALGKAASGTGSTLGQAAGALDQSGTVNPWGTINESYSWTESPPSPGAVGHSHSIPASGSMANNAWPNFTGWQSQYSTTGTGCCGLGAVADSLVSANESWTANATGTLTASASVTPAASYTVANPAYRVVRYLISLSNGASPAGCALWGYGSNSLPGSTQLANGSAASGSLSSCLDAAFAGSLPDMRGRIPVGLASSGSASTLAGAGGAVDQTVSASLTAAASQASVTPAGWTATLTEGSHSHSYTGAAVTGGSGGNWMGTYGANNTAPSVSANSNAGSVYTSGTYSPGALTASGAGAQAPTSSSFNTAFETVNWFAYTTSSYSPTAGVISAYAGSSAPTGWLLTDGSCYSTSGTYASLFGVIGYSYGGSGASFCVPDLRGRFALGVAAAGTGSTLGASGGSLAPAPLLSFTGFTPQITIPSHTLSWSVPAHTHDVGFSGANSLGNSGGFVGSLRYGTVTSNGGGGGTVNSTVGAYAVNATSVGAGSGSPSVSPPPFRALNYIIKY